MNATTRRGTTANHIRDQLKDEIMSGRIEEGTRLKQNAIAEQFHTSRVPVREALKQLEAEGLVKFHPRRGAEVSRIEFSEFLEMFDIRVALECYTLGLAIPNMTHSDVGKASAILEEYDDDPESFDDEKWDDLNWRFHSTLYLPAHKPRLYALIKDNYFHAARFHRLKLAEATGRDVPVQEHKDILEACGRGDVDDGVRLLKDHILDSQKSLATIIHTNSVK